MLISRIAPPDGTDLVAAVSLSEAKRHCRVYHDQDDAEIAGLVLVAQAAIEGADGTGGALGRAITRHTLELKLPAFPPLRRLMLPQPPLISVTSVKYLDPAGAEQTLSAALYHVVPETRGGFIELKSTASWPSVVIAPDAVRVRFLCGPDACPADIKHAILLHVGFLYLNREAAGESLAELPLAYKRLLDPHKTHGWI